RFPLVVRYFLLQNFAVLACQIISEGPFNSFSVAASVWQTAFVTNRAFCNTADRMFPNGALFGYKSAFISAEVKQREFFQPHVLGVTQAARHQSISVFRYPGPL